MKVYGADFSGAMNPSKGIYYAQGSLSAGKLSVEQIVHCDDRLDLLAAIHFSKAPWGLDFPFSIANEALTRLQVNSWEELLPLVLKYERKGFDRFITDSGIPACESQCRDQSICCRATDAAVQAFSPLKKTRPNMRMMSYAGLKLLSYLHRLGNVVYPFDELHEGVSRLYEVYPSHTWKQVKLPRGTDLGPFVELFSHQYGLKVKLKKHHLKMENQDVADAVVACVAMAYAVDKYNLEADWSKKHSWISDEEWEHRYKEGLIVRVH